MDLEWNGAYSRKAHGYFNEIIDIGAVKLDSDLRELDRFQAVIKPSISRKLSDIVQNLTHIEPEELDRGVTFGHMDRRGRSRAADVEPDRFAGADGGFPLFL